MGPDLEAFDRCAPVSQRRLERQEFAFSGSPAEGGRYLVAGRREAATACLTRTWSEELAARYATAFADAQP